jgi:hypothetical protein
MAQAAEEDPAFREQLAQLAEARGDIYAYALSYLTDVVPLEDERVTVSS